MAWLDYSGLEHFLDKIKEYVDDVVSSIGAITGVKGDAESAYRVGNVNLTQQDIGVPELVLGDSYMSTYDNGGPVTIVAKDANFLVESQDSSPGIDVALGVATASTSVALSNLGSGTKTLYLYRFGHIVVAHMNATTTPSSANAAISAGTVPSGYRPAQNAFMGGPRVTNNSLNGTYRWRVTTAGAVTFWTSSTGTYETPLLMCWYTSNAFPS